MIYTQSGIHRINIEPNQTMKTKHTRHGLTIFKRYADQAGALWYTRMRVLGKIKTLSLAETAEKSFEIAVNARRAKREGKFDVWREATSTRHTAPVGHSMSDLAPHYRAYPGRILSTTKEANLNALHRLVAHVHDWPAGSLQDQAWQSVRLDAYTADLCRKWKRKVEFAAAEAESEDRRQQLLRSANSTLAAARSVFACSRRNDLPAYYRECGIELPPCIAEFRAVPGFSSAAKTEYNPPPAAVILETLRVLDRMALSLDEQEQNVAIACWCAIGFGLRASAIQRTLVGDFVRELDGDIFYRPLAFRAGKRAKQIGVQNDAWERLARHVDGRAANEYLLHGSATERTSETCRRISALFKSLGWQTQHHIHELRAWAGCQVIKGADGKQRNWEAGRLFLNHKFLSTTQKFYGHHLDPILEKVPLPNLAVA